MVTTTSAATIASSSHYQASLRLACNGAQLCRAEFPSLGNRRPLTLTRMSCVLRSAEYAEYASGQMEVIAANGSQSLVQLLPADYSSKWGYDVINSAIDVQIASKQRFSVSLFLAPGSGVAYQATCAAQGIFEVLQ
jgi:hypothetical protein